MESLEYSKYCPKKFSIEIKQLVIPVRVEPTAAATSLAWNGSIVAGGKREERGVGLWEERRNQSGNCSITDHHAILQTLHGLLHGLLRYPGKEEGSLPPPSEP